MRKRIPKFRNEDKEQNFWSENDSSEYLNWENAEQVLFPNLKPSTKLMVPSDTVEFARLVEEARKQAKATGLKPKDVKTAVAKARKK